MAGAFNQFTDMTVRTISKELQQIAISELNEDPSSVQENLQHLRDWLKKQPHLIAKLDDQSLITFLRGCKWSLQRAKEKIDYFYTFRTLTPDFFMIKDPFDPVIQKMLQKGIVCQLPNTDGPAGAKILFIDCSVIDSEVMDPIAFLNLAFMVTDVLTFSDDNFLISGGKYILNYSNIPLSFILQFTPAMIIKFISGWMTAYPLRQKLLLGINTPPVMEKFFSTLVLPFLSKKHQNRIYLFTPENIEKAYCHIPKTLFPEEFGGDSGSKSKLVGEFKTMVESFKEWLLEDRKYSTNENLRLGKPKIFNEEFGLEGTFRKLNID